MTTWLDLITSALAILTLAALGACLVDWFFFGGPK